MSPLGAIGRLWPLLLLLAALIAAYALGLTNDLSWHFLAREQQTLRGYAAARPALAVISYTLLYAALTALSVPGGLVMTMAGGLVFGTALGAASVVAGATAGATVAFLAARYALGGWFAQRAAPAIERIRPGLERDGVSYLLALRLLPIVPFWLVNLAAGMVGMNLGRFLVATFLGIIPATVVFASVGHGLAAVLAAGRTPDASVILRPAILLPLAGLALLALIPVAWRRRAARG